MEVIMYSPCRELRPIAVIPAKAGIHLALCGKAKWIPAFAGMTAVRKFVRTGNDSLRSEKAIWS
jgi:hypothetical protein